MNTLEVTYADRAGRLSEGSPDKVKIEELEAALGELDGKAGLIYDLSNENVDDLTLEQFNNINNGKYIFTKFNADKYYIVNYVDNYELELVQCNGDYIYVNKYTIQDNVPVMEELVYHIGCLSASQTAAGNVGNVLTLDEGKDPVWQAPAEPGTKLYRHELTITKEGITPVRLHIISTSATNATGPINSGPYYLPVDIGTMVGYIPISIHVFALFNYYTGNKIYFTPYEISGNGTITSVNIGGGGVVDVVTEL